MPLRLRLIVLVTAALCATLVLGGAVGLVNASRSVRTEMAAALQVGRQTVDNVVRQIDIAADPQREIDDLIDSFKGSRHLHVSVEGGAVPHEVPAADDRPSFDTVPTWFARLVGVVPKTDRVPFTIAGRPAGTVVIETDPRNEIREVWNELSGSLLVLTLFGAGTLPLICVLIGRALRPLGRLTAAMEQVGHGDYAIRVGDRLAPELARLRDSFNRMAGRLAATDADNRRLNEQLLNLQEEERNDVARDLHDEIGPLLFALNVDVANIGRLLEQGRTDELAAHTRSVTESVRALQRQVRGMLGRLRPIGLTEFGLVTAISGLTEFWRRRYPEIDYAVRIAPACERLGDPIDTTIYRIVQECFSNAVRHGRPEAISISIGRDGPGDDIQVEVIDDGAGAGPPLAPGYGLIGMDERVKAMGGSLRFANRADGGFAVVASLPCPSPAAARAAPPAVAAQ
jgi:two-component system sensor histidine kinase UhpB